MVFPILRSLLGPLPVDLAVQNLKLKFGAAAINQLLTRNSNCFDDRPMKQAKKRPAKKRPNGPKTTEPSDALKKRLEDEFAQAVSTAKYYVEDPERLHALFLEASKEAASIPKESFGETWPYLQAMLRLIRACYRGHYTVNESTLVVIIAAIVYLVSPLDMIPDAVPALGFLDDAAVLSLALRRTREDLDEFMIWETSTI